MDLGSFLCSAMPAHILTQLQATATTASLPPSLYICKWLSTSQPISSPWRHQVELGFCQLLHWHSVGNLLEPSLSWDGTGELTLTPEHKSIPSHSQQAGKLPVTWTNRGCRISAREKTEQTRRKDDLKSQRAASTQWMSTTAWQEKSQRSLKQIWASS